MKRILIVALCLGLAFTSIACDCNQERKPMKELLKNSKAVFIGKVISFKRSLSTSFEEYYEIKLSIDSSIVGDSVKQITVFTEPSDCGQFLRVGKTYLVYAFLNKNSNLSLDYCHSGCFEINAESVKSDLLEIKNLRSN